MASIQSDVWAGSPEHLNHVMARAAQQAFKSDLQRMGPCTSNAGAYNLERHSVPPITREGKWCREATSHRLDGHLYKYGRKS